MVTNNENKATNALREPFGQGVETMNIHRIYLSISKSYYHIHCFHSGENSLILSIYNH